MIGINGFAFGRDIFLGLESLAGPLLTPLGLSCFLFGLLLEVEGERWNTGEMDDFAVTSVSWEELLHWSVCLVVSKTKINKLSGR